MSKPTKAELQKLSTLLIQLENPRLIDCLLDAMALAFKKKATYLDLLDSLTEILDSIHYANYVNLCNKSNRLDKTPILRGDR